MLVEKTVGFINSSHGAVSLRQGGEKKGKKGVTLSTH